MIRSLATHPRRGGDALYRRQSSACGRVGVVGMILGLLLSACASQPVVADLRPAYGEARVSAVSQYLSCDGVSALVCDCRRGGLEQEFAAPSPARFDAGYAAFTAFRADPANKGHTAADAEAHAVRAIFAAITADVENICSYHEEEEATN